MFVGKILSGPHEDGKSFEVSFLFFLFIFFSIFYCNIVTVLLVFQVVLDVGNFVLKEIIVTATDKTIFVNDLCQRWTN